MAQYRLLEKLLSVVNEPDPAQPIVEVCGDRRVLIEHYYGVTEYGLQRICVAVKFGCVQICGNQLRLRKMQKQTLVVTGLIDSILIIRG